MSVPLKPLGASAGPRLVMPIAELRARALVEPEPAWIVAPFVPDVGVVILAGPAKAGKTYIALGMLAAAAIGRDFAGYFPTRATRSLVIEAEGTARGLARRLDAVARGLGLPDAGVLEELGVCPPDLVRGTGFRLDANWVRVLGERCYAHNVRAVVLDSARRLSCVEENDARQVAALIEPLSELARNLRLAVILLHHTRKPSGRGGPVTAFDVRGSGDWFAAADSLITVVRDETLLTLAATHRESEEQTFRLRVDFSDPVPRGLAGLDLAGVTPAGGAPRFTPSPPPSCVRFTLDPGRTVGQRAGADPAELDRAIRAILSDPGMSKREARRRVRAAGVRAQNGTIDRVLEEVKDAASSEMDSR